MAGVAEQGGYHAPQADGAGVIQRDQGGGRQVALGGIANCPQHREGQAMPGGDAGNGTAFQIQRADGSVLTGHASVRLLRVSFFTRDAKGYVVCSGSFTFFSMEALYSLHFFQSHGTISRIGSSGMSSK